MDIFEFFSMFVLDNFSVATVYANSKTVMGSGMGKDVWTLTEKQITNTAKASIIRRERTSRREN